MKRKILSLIMSLMVISSFKVYATDYQYLKEIKFTGWDYDKETKQQNYYKDGNIVINNWVNTNGHKYYFKADGSEAIGWVQLNTNWYYFDTMGAMQTGWWYDNNTTKWYYFNSDGIMAHDTNIDGYSLGSDGVWIK